MDVSKEVQDAPGYQTISKPVVVGTNYDLTLTVSLFQCLHSNRGERSGQIVDCAISLTFTLDCIPTYYEKGRKLVQSELTDLENKLDYMQNSSEFHRTVLHYLDTLYRKYTNIFQSFRPPSVKAEDSIGYTCSEFLGKTKKKYNRMRTEKHREWLVGHFHESLIQRLDEQWKFVTLPSSYYDQSSYDFEKWITV